MKKQTNKLSFWLVGCLVMLGLSFAACNPGGDDNPTLTPEQQQQAYQQAREIMQVSSSLAAWMLLMAISLKTLLPFVGKSIQTQR